MSKDYTSAILEIENGPKFDCYYFGKEKQVAGELVFQTGITGYPETLTDPSYAGQLIVFTTPLINNYSFPENDTLSRELSFLSKFNINHNLESDKCHASGIIVSEYTGHSDKEVETRLSKWCEENDIVGVSGIDTRALTLYIREQGDCRARIYSREAINIIDYIDISKLDLVGQVLKDMNNETIYYDNGSNKTVLFYDCGAKNSQLINLLKRGLNIHRVPYNYDIYANNNNSENHSKNPLDRYDGIFMSNGPGNPEHNTNLIYFIRQLIEDKINIPIFGICLGHQILSIAAYLNIYKMKYGNRGQNIPVIMNTNGNENTYQRCFITSQNHGYCVDTKILKSLEENIEWSTLFTNVNDNTNEGIVHKSLPYFSCQFHPEAAPGPNDTEFLFDIFTELIENYNCLKTNLNSESRNLNSESRNLTSIIKEYSDYNTNNTPDTIITQGKVLILGSGGLSIGQAGEFDYSGSQAIKAYNEVGLETILINPNIATIQTSKGLADKIYYAPINVNFVEQIIEKECIDYISISFGGQTALNCALELHSSGILDKFKVRVLGTPLSSINISEDRSLFKKELNGLGIETPPSDCANDINTALIIANKIGYPVLVRAGFCLGGQGSGFANNNSELEGLVSKALQISDCVIIDKSLEGYKEVEYEIMRDFYDNKISVCNMENIDALGVHTGESIVVAPSQTLDNKMYQKLRSICFKIVSHLKVIGECNVQFAIDPETGAIYVIEMNARLSRSSALASKATGYPLAYIAAKVSLGFSLTELGNNITKKTCACFEPSLDYIVVKFPRWDLDKFPNVSKELGSHMKSIGEVMAIGRNFRETLQKAIRMVGNLPELSPENDRDKYSLLTVNELKQILRPHPRRIIDIYNILYHDILTVEQLFSITKITRWFLNQINEIALNYKQLVNTSTYENNLKDIIITAKKNGFSDRSISIALGKNDSFVTNYRHTHGIYPFVKKIDTVAGEFPCETNYLYLTYNAVESDTFISNKDSNNNSVIVLGSGVYRIGSSVEFDWCAVSCVRQLRELGIKPIMINNNPETVSTDYDEAYKLYFEELSLETVYDIYNIESKLNSNTLKGNTLKGLILSMGGQIANNMAMDLLRLNEISNLNINILGTCPTMIDNAENRFKFSRLLDKIEIDQPLWKTLSSLLEASLFCNNVGYPCLVRPSYVLSGAGMKIVYNETQLVDYLEKNTISSDNNVVISKFIENAKEIEVDAVANKGQVVILAISEHIENAGVHSGDATLVLPAQDLNSRTIEKIKIITFKIAANLNINGPFNLQLIAKDDSLKVIECNLRVSRSFPFASKTLDINMIDVATKIIVQSITNQVLDIPETIKFTRIGVKVPQFSFHRLENTDVHLGVEMASTGEVACFGNNRNIAYLKALMSTGFKLPCMTKCNILISIATDDFKEEFKSSVKLINNIKWKIYGTKGTTEYYKDNINITYDNDIISNIKNKYYDLIINVSSGNNINEFKRKLGYKIRRFSLDYKIPLITNIKCAKLFIESIYYYWCKCLRIDSKSDIIYSDETRYRNLSLNDKNELLPSVIENSLQCISYKEEINIDLPFTKILFTDRHIITSNQFNRNLLRQIFLRTQEIMNCYENKRYDRLNGILKNKVIGLLFYCPSTRTRCSFESAIKRLGGECIIINADKSSVQKGETLYDTIKTLECYCDALVIRTDNNVELKNHLNEINIPIINAGDRFEHPTQSLLDIYTIREERGTVNNISIALVGDLYNGRTINSLVKCLINYNVTIYFVAPKELQIPDTIIELLKNERDHKSETGHTINYSKVYDLDSVLDKVDVIYMTRLQKERITGFNCNTANEIENEYNKFVLNENNINKTKENVLILHPLPRNNEIDKALDSNKKCVYFRQMKYGMFTRMALLEMVLCR